jgi:hypothetical protein
MQIRDCLATLVLLCMPVAAHGQDTPMPSLEEAQRAFAASLERHDRAAFEAMFAPDAESSLPSVKHGPEAIANSWLPFLIDPGTTMLLTNSEAVVTAPGVSGRTSGTFDIRGRTANGIRTIPGGTYEIVWRIIDGRWKINALGGSGRRPVSRTDRGGVGPYRFGMTRTEGSQLPDCQPYKPVAVTGGLEMNISFIFAGDSLRRIQLWYYDGESEQDARAAVGRVLSFLQRTAGTLVLSSRPGAPVTTDSVMSAIAAAPADSRGVMQVELGTATRPQSESWFSRIGRHPGGYLVMLFADPAVDP